MGLGSGGGLPSTPATPLSRPAEGRRGAGVTPVFQSFGSPNKKHVGIILQRGMLVLLLCCLPCWALFLNTQLILLLCRQDPAVSRCAGAGRAKSPWEAHSSPCCPLWVSSRSMGAWSGDSPPQHAAPAVVSRGQTAAHFN